MGFKTAIIWQKRDCLLRETLKESPRAFKQNEGRRAKSTAVVLNLCSSTTVPRVMATPIIKLFLLLLHYYIFATVMDCNVNIFRNKLWPRLRTSRLEDHHWKPMTWVGEANQLIGTLVMCLTQMNYEFQSSLCYLTAPCLKKSKQIKENPEVGLVFKPFRWKKRKPCRKNVLYQFVLVWIQMVPIRLTCLNGWATD